MPEYPSWQHYFDVVYHHAMKPLWVRRDARSWSGR